MESEPQTYRLEVLYATAVLHPEPRKKNSGPKPKKLGNIQPKLFVTYPPSKLKYLLLKLVDKCIFLFLLASKIQFAVMGLLKKQEIFQV